MNTKRYLTAIASIAIIFFSFNNINDKQVKNSNTNIDKVKELKSFYHKSIADFTKVLDPKGLTKVIEKREVGTEDPDDAPLEYTLYTYFNSDTTLRYAFLTYNNRVESCSYYEINKAKSTANNQSLKAKNLLLDFEKYLVNLKNLVPPKAEFNGYISAENGKFEKYYSRKDLILADFKAKTTTLNNARLEYYFDVEKVEVTYHRFEDNNNEYIFVYYGADLATHQEYVKF